MGKALLVVALFAVAVSAVNIVTERRAQHALTAATRVTADTDDFWPKALATYATHSALFKSADYPRDAGTHLYDTSALQAADKQGFEDAVANSATFSRVNSGLDISGIQIDVNAIIAAGGKEVDRLNFEKTAYYQAAAQPKMEVFKFANNAGVRLMWDDTTNPTILTPWLAGVREGLTILRKHQLQPPAGMTIDLHLAKWQKQFQVKNGALTNDNATPALADAQAWHWATSGIILTTGSISRKFNSGLGVPFGVADQVLDAENARRNAQKKSALTPAEVFQLRAAYNVIHEFVHCLHAQQPQSRPLFFETQKSEVKFSTAYGLAKGGKAHPAPWLPVSGYAAQFASPREFVAEIGTKILAIAERRLPKSALVPKPLSGHPKSNHLTAYRVFGGEFVVPSRLAK